MAEMPWSKFFWSDWEADQGLRLCSLAAQGLWMRMLCVCARHEPKGYLSINGNPLTVDAIARLAGVAETEAETLVDELERNGVFSRNRTGCIYSRRMVKDEKRSQEGRKHKKRGLKEASENKGKNREPSRGPSRGASPQKPEARGQIYGGGGDARAKAPETAIENQTFRERILAACGVGPDGLIGASGRLIGRREEMIELQREMDAHGVMEADVICLVEEAMRTKNAGREPGPPNTLRFFFPSIRRFAAAARSDVAPLPTPPPVGPLGGGARDQRRQDAEERERRIVDAAVHGTAKGFG